MRVLRVDLTVFGDSPVIETRLPRELIGRLAVGDAVLVSDDAVEPMPFRIEALLDEGRDVRLIRVLPAAVAGDVDAEAADDNDVR